LRRLRVEESKFSLCSECQLEIEAVLTEEQSIYILYFHPCCSSIYLFSNNRVPGKFNMYKIRDPSIFRLLMVHLARVEVRVVRRIHIIPARRLTSKLKYSGSSVVSADIRSAYELHGYFEVAEI
jgi:hypothetical protein